MKLTYFAIVNKKEGQYYPVIVPDIPGCFTEGTTMEEVKAMAEDAISTLLADYAANGMPYPQASQTYEELISKVGDDCGEIAYVIPITVYPSSRIIRISMTGAEDKLEYIKDFAAKCGTTRSAFMIDAAMNAIAHANGD
ncbi:MAG: type II toxin-antitoxin system HicB family antitoxin [Victivallales bacterium]|nr:type II toxin-antitoxin system HicB family antitoxin [Victivallales bacterium]